MLELYGRQNRSRPTLRSIPREQALRRTADVALRSRSAGRPPAVQTIPSVWVWGPIDSTSRVKKPGMVFAGHRVMQREKVDYLARAQQAERLSRTVGGQDAQLLKNMAEELRALAREAQQLVEQETRKERA